MREVHPTQVSPRLAALFDPNAPASLRCFAVLAGLVTGRTFTDDPIHPTWGVVWEMTDGTLYPGGAITAPRLQQAVSVLRPSGDVLIGYWPDDPLADLLPPAPEYDGTVLEFLDRPDDLTDLDAIVQRLPSGHTLRHMDPALLKRDVRSHGRADAFLANHVAVCLMRGETIMCEASTGPAINGVRELGVLTHAANRGRGFATMTCAYLIQECAAAGTRTYWNCASTNAASAAVARKLGYQIEREYQLVAWFKRNA